MSPTDMVVGSFCLALVAVILAAAIFGRLPIGKWWAILLTTLSGPFIMLVVIRATAKTYWALSSNQGSGCSGGECGVDAIAAGYWPLLIPLFLPFAFFLAWPTIAIYRRRRG